MAVEPGRPRLPRWVFAVLALAALVQFILAARLELAPDEAYYWLWSRHPSLSYYDHPPMVAAFIWLGTHIAGHTELGVRLLGPLSLLATSLLLAGAARDLGGGRLAMITAALFAPVTVGGLAAAVLMTPDTPLLAASALVLRLLAAAAAGASGPIWIPIGAAIGFALLAKYTALALGLGAFLWLVLTPRRRALMTPWPWLGALAALAVFSPVIIWNLQHGFASFQKQGGRAGVAFRPSFASFAEFAGSQLALATPILGALAVTALIIVLRDAVRRGSDRAILLGSMSLPVLAFFLVRSIGARSEANWTVVALPATALATALFIEGRFQRPRIRAWARAGYGMGALVVLAVALYLLVPLRHGLGRRDFTYRLSGHAALANGVAQAAAALGTRTVVTGGYGDAAELAFYGKRRFDVTSFTERQRYVTMMPPLDETVFARGPVLAVAPDIPAFLTLFELGFQNVTPLGHIERRHRGTVIRRYALYRAEGYKTGFLQSVDDWVRRHELGLSQ